MVNATNPWLDRGGRAENEAEAGTFTFNNAHGGVYNMVSFRQIPDYK